MKTRNKKEKLEKKPSLPCVSAPKDSQLPKSNLAETRPVEPAVSRPKRTVGLTRKPKPVDAQAKDVASRVSKTIPSTSVRYEKHLIEITSVNPTLSAVKAVETWKQGGDTKNEDLNGAMQLKEKVNTIPAEEIKDKNAQIVAKNDPTVSQTIDVPKEHLVQQQEESKRLLVGTNDKQDEPTRPVVSAMTHSPTKSALQSIVSRVQADDHSKDQNACPVAQSITESAVKSVKEIAKESTVESVKESAGEPIRESAKETVTESSKESADQSAHQHINQPIPDSVKQSTVESGVESTSRPVQPTSPLHVIKETPPRAKSPGPSFPSTQSILQRVEDLKKRNEATKRRQEERNQLSRSFLFSTPSKTNPDMSRILTHHPHGLESRVLAAAKDLSNLSLLAEDLTLPNYTKPRENNTERSFISFVSAHSAMKLQPFQRNETLKEHSKELPKEVKKVLLEKPKEVQKDSPDDQSRVPKELSKDPHTEPSKEQIELPKEQMEPPNEQMELPNKQTEPPKEQQIEPKEPLKELPQRTFQGPRRIPVASQKRGNAEEVSVEKNSKKRQIDTQPTETKLPSNRPPTNRAAKPEGAWYEEAQLHRLIEEQYRMVQNNVGLMSHFHRKVISPDLVFLMPDSINLDGRSGKGE